MLDVKEALVQSPIKGRSSKESISKSCNLENNSDYLDSSSASSCSKKLTGPSTTTGQTADCRHVPNTNLKQILICPKIKLISFHLFCFILLVIYLLVIWTDSKNFLF